MSLSAEEYREHLATTAVRAGFEFRDVVLPGEGDIQHRRIAAALSGLGQQRQSRRSCFCTAGR